MVWSHATMSAGQLDQGYAAGEVKVLLIDNCTPGEVATVHYDRKANRWSARCLAS